MDLSEDNQRYGQMIELTHAPVDLDRRLRCTDAALLTAIGQLAVSHGEIRVHPRLQAEIADTLRGLQTKLAGVDGALRVLRAVEDAEIGETAAFRLQQTGFARYVHAALERKHGIGRAIEPRECHTLCVERHRDRTGAGAAFVFARSTGRREAFSLC